MEIIYAYETASDYDRASIFLAGPSPRQRDDFNWRTDALAELEKQNFEGNVFVPLPRNGVWSDDYVGQVEWELKHLETATVIAFWIPRDREKLPAFTTNVEFGMFLKSEKIVLGFPPEAEKMKYIEYVARKNNVSVFYDLAETISQSIKETKNKSQPLD